MYIYCDFVIGVRYFFLLHFYAGNMLEKCLKTPKTKSQNKLFKIQHLHIKHPVLLHF